MTIDRKDIGYALLTLLLVCTGVYSCGVLGDQQSFTHIIAGYGLTTLGLYLGWKRQLSFPIFVVIGLFARLLLLPYPPMLSDDYYRFYWDGKLLWHGMSPYQYIPVATPEHFQSLYPSIVQEMNSPHYYSIYPPILQGLFMTSSWGSIAQFLWSYKAVFMLSECLTILGLVKVLKHVGKDVRNTIFYVLNPAIIIEGVGNLHAEILAVTCLVWFYYFYVKDSKWLSTSFILFGFGIKLLPILLAPWIVFHNKSRHRWMYVMMLLIGSLVVFSPILFYVPQYLQSLDLYFQTFEFNASVYYLLRQLGQVMSGYNLIWYLGPGLLILALIGIYYTMKYTIDKGKLYIADFWIWSLAFYFLLSTTVHPWYTLLLVPYGIIRGYRFPIYWSIAAVLSYIYYYKVGSSNIYYLFICVEYVGLLYLMYIERKKLLSLKC